MIVFGNMISELYFLFPILYGNLTTAELFDMAYLVEVLSIYKQT